MLYLIRVLHQTTTHYLHACDLIGCILFVFYIKPQHMIMEKEITVRCILFVFYIKPQRLADAQAGVQSCILFVFYIKPQLAMFAI